MNVRLLVKSGSSQKRVLKLQCEETVVGRQKGCDLRIPSNEVSRRHCLLSMHDGCLNVEDLDSANGTIVNGERISGRQILMPGDTLQIGPVCFQAEYEMSPATRARLEGESGTGEDVEALPLANGAAEPSEAAAEELDELPIVEEAQTTRLMTPPTTADPEAGALPVESEFLDSEAWQAPAEGDLRDLLSQLDDEPPKSGKK